MGCQGTLFQVVTARMESPGRGSGCHRCRGWFACVGGRGRAEHHGVPSIPARGQNSNDLTAKRVLQEGGEKGQMGTGGPAGTLSPSSRNRSPERGAGDGRAAGMAFHTPPSPARIPIPASLGVLSTGSCESCAPRVLPEGTLYPKYPTLPLFFIYLNSPGN